MRAWHAVFEGRPVTVAETEEVCEKRVFGNQDQANPYADLYGVLQEIAGQRGGLNRRILGKFLSGKVGRIAKGLVLERHAARSEVAAWRCVAEHEAGAMA